MNILKRDGLFNLFNVKAVGANSSNDEKPRVVPLKMMKNFRDRFIFFGIQQ